jgi:hypothetical protein
MMGSDGGVRAMQTDPTGPPTDHPAVELRPPEGWRVLRVGYSTPSLRLRDGVSGAWYFAVAPGTDDGEAAFRAAIAAWAADSATRAAQREARYGFNYGDAIELTKPAHWRRFGLVLLTLPEHDHCQVDHDDVLVERGRPPTDDGEPADQPPLLPHPRGHLRCGST